MAFDGNIREATVRDRDFIIAEAERLAAFGPPEWRTPAEVVARERQELARFFDQRPPGTELFIAEDRAGVKLGYVFLDTEHDYFTRQPHGHVDILVVSEAGEGRGVGGALLRESERWARSRGFTKITLNVFELNAHARRVYEHMGYRPESLHYIKPLEADDA